MPDCSPTCVASREEVPAHIDSMLKDHKVVLFTNKDDKKGDEIACVLNSLEVKNMHVADVGRCAQKEELLLQLKKRASNTPPPYLFICGHLYTGAENALNDSGEKEKLKQKLKDCGGL